MQKLDIDLRPLAVKCLKTSKYSLNEQNIERLTNMFKEKIKHALIYYPNLSVNQAIQLAQDEFRYGSQDCGFHKYYDSIFDIK